MMDLKTQRNIEKIPGTNIFFEKTPMFTEEKLLSNFPYVYHIEKRRRISAVEFTTQSAIENSSKGQ